MVFVGAVILPHGAMPFDGDPESRSEACRERYYKLPPHIREKCCKIYQGCLEAADVIASLRPDVIILDSPHGLGLTSSVAVILNNVAAGSAKWNNQWDEFKVNIACDDNMALELIEHFQNCGLPCEGINCFTMTEAPLRWGEAIPIWYLQQALTKLKQDVKYVITSQPKPPKRKRVLGQSDLDLRMNTGRALHKFISQTEKRIVVAISGDLGHAFHTYCKDPLYLSDPRWNMPVNHQASAHFSHVIKGWCTSLENSKLIEEVKFPLSSETNDWKAAHALPWILKASDLNPTALTCGITGFTVLHGVLEEVTKAGNKVKVKQIVSEAPTYYGMMAATFLL